VRPEFSQANDAREGSTEAIRHNSCDLHLKVKLERAKRSRRRIHNAARGMKEARRQFEAFAFVEA